MDQKWGADRHRPVRPQIGKCIQAVPPLIGGSLVNRIGRARIPKRCRLQSGRGNPRAIRLMPEGRYTQNQRKIGPKAVTIAADIKPIRMVSEYEAPKRKANAANSNHPAIREIPRAAFHSYADKRE